MQRRPTGLLAVTALGTLLSGCVAGPAYPLMTPIQVAQTYGFNEKPLDGNRFEVSYVTPPRQALGYRFDTSPTADQAKTMAFDLASLRTAQLAQQSGWQGFDVVDKHSSSDDEFIGPDWDNGPWGGGWGYGWGWHRHRFWGSGPDFYEPPRQTVQAEVKLTVVFTNTIKAGDYRAADVIQQVGARYPGVMTPGPAAAPAAAAVAPVPPAKPSA